MIPARLAFLLAILLMSVVALADETAKTTIEDKITTTAIDHRLRLDYDGDVFSGPAWDRLVTVVCLRSASASAC